MVCLLAKILWKRAVQPHLQPPQPRGEGVLRAGVSQPGWEPRECGSRRGAPVLHRAAIARPAGALLAPP